MQAGAQEQQPGQLDMSAPIPLGQGLQSPRGLEFSAGRKGWETLAISGQGPLVINGLKCALFSLPALFSIFTCHDLAKSGRFQISRLFKRLELIIIRVCKDKLRYKKRGP